MYYSDLQKNHFCRASYATYHRLSCFALLFLLGLALHVFAVAAPPVPTTSFYSCSWELSLPFDVGEDAEVVILPGDGLATICPGSQITAELKAKGTVVRLTLEGCSALTSSALGVLAQIEIKGEGNEFLVELKVDGGEVLVVLIDD